MLEFNRARCSASILSYGCAVNADCLWLPLRRRHVPNFSVPDSPWLPIGSREYGRALPSDFGGPGSPIDHAHRSWARKS